MNDVVSSILQHLSKALRTFLQNALEGAGDNWWEKHVVESLSFQQQKVIGQRKVTTLSGLDLAALLRVLDQNWHLLSGQFSAPAESRNYLKEMQTIRNRWAHTFEGGVDDEITYRDLDTIQRFASAIEAEPNFIQSVRTVKDSLIKTKAQLPAQLQTTAPITNSTPRTEFIPGQMVLLKVDPATRGVVTSVISGTTENRYVVFFGAKTNTFYASQLAAVEESTDLFEPLDLVRFHAHLSSLYILHPGISTLYSLNSARVAFIPYQFRPVLRFIRSDRPRLLIADGVGVGKTIEAGLILRELQARRDIKSVLIICPRALITERKWDQEMRRFDERFTSLDRAALSNCIRETDLDGTWPEQHVKTIVSFSAFDESILHGQAAAGVRRSKKGLLQLDPAPRFDLIIVDEAHHVRNTETYAHKGVRFFCENAEAVVFLTATPIQLGSHDLFVLLNLLRPDLVIDKQVFTHMSEPNPHLHRASDLVRSLGIGWREEARGALLDAATTSWGRAILQSDPRFQQVFDLLGLPDITGIQRIQCINTLEALNSFAGVINRTRRRDIGNFTVRKPETVSVDFTPSQRSLHDELLATQARILTSLHGETSVAFMLSTLRRQAASCLYGLAPMIKDILNRRLEAIDEDLPEEMDASDVNEGALSIETQVQQVVRQAESLDPRDPKLEALRKIIRTKQELRNNKLMVFSTFRHTLAYLMKNLAGEGLRVAMVHGGTPDEDRVESRRRFKLSPSDGNTIDVLLFSEVGSEGLDYQFCDCMVNYDLPWNPMRIEQRIGRIDRNGQQSETVTIYNLITPGTVDADIYNRCLLRIGVFSGALGAGEEILGQITKEIHAVAENLNLTEFERAAKLQQIADNSVRLVEEQQMLEQKQAELFGLRVPSGGVSNELDDATSYWLSGQSLENLASEYLSSRCGGNGEYLVGEKSLKTIRLSQEAREKVLEDYQKLPSRPSVVNREWETWLRGPNPHLQITFDAECATENPNITFITPVHPLVRQAAAHFGSARSIFAAISVSDPEIPAGEHPFAIYQWRTTGIREDLRLEPVSNLAIPTEKFLRLLQRGTSVKLGEGKIPSKDTFDGLDQSHYQKWSTAREEHREWTSQMVAFRRESLSTSHRARMALLKDQLAQATDEKIQRMRQSQIFTAEADYARRLSELESALSKSDITSEVIAFGVLQILHEVKFGQQL